MQRIYQLVPLFLNYKIKTMTQLYNGLSAQQVAENRRSFGANIISSVPKQSFMERLQNVVSCRLIRGIIIVNIAMLFLLLFCDLFTGQVTCSNCSILVVAMLLLLLVFIVVYLIGNWNEKKQRMEVSPMIAILIFVLAVSSIVAYYQNIFMDKHVCECYFEPFGIAIVVLLATLVISIVKRKNEHTFRLLNEAHDEMLVKVIRDGCVLQVASKEIVVGDIIVLETGIEVAADAELLKATNLMVNESPLTGEPECKKVADYIDSDKESLFPVNHVLRGSIVLRGEGIARVFAVGDHTAISEVRHNTTVETIESTTLQQELNVLACKITKISYIIAAIIVVGRIGIYASGNIRLSTTDDYIALMDYMTDTIMLIATLLVVSIPEGIPMAMSLSFAFTSKRLMRRNIIPRNKQSCETIGAITIICTNKSGVLTYGPKWVRDNYYTENGVPVDVDLKETDVLADCLRADVPQAVQDTFRAGIEVIIITSEHLDPACAIARRIGILQENDGKYSVLLGAECEELSDAELIARLKFVKVVAQARPYDKERIVRLLKSMGHVVAVTGDSMDDAPSLVSADVGLLLGDGNSGAKEVSDMIVTDSSYSTISNAIMWGRAFYTNIQRFVFYQLTINIVASLIIITSAFLSSSSPLSITQMLWVNLILVGFAAVALGSLPASRCVMRIKSRPVHQSILYGMKGRLVMTSLAMSIVLILVLLVFFHIDVHSLTEIDWRWGVNKGVSSYEATLYFNIFVLMQWWNLFNARALMLHHSALQGLSIICNPWFVFILLLILMMQIMIIETPAFQKLFSIISGGILWMDWVIIFLSTSMVLWVGEFVRYVHFSKQRSILA